MNKIYHILIPLFFGLIFIPGIVFGQGQLTTPDIAGTSEDNTLITCGTDQNECEFDDLVDLVQKGLELVFAFGAFIAAAMFMYAGFLLITAVGNPTQIQKAKNIFKRVIVGFIIMFLAFITISQTLKFLKANEVFINIIEL